MIAMETQPLYRTEEVCELVGCTYRQLDYWVRTGVIRPHTQASGSGTQRFFSEADIKEVRMVADIAALFGPGSGFGQVWNTVRERGAEATLVELWTAFDALAEKYGLG